jgi:hypothetical protein
MYTLLLLSSPSLALTNLFSAFKLDFGVSVMPIIINVFQVYFQNVISILEVIIFLPKWWLWEPDIAQKSMSLRLSYTVNHMSLD